MPLHTGVDVIMKPCNRIRIFHTSDWHLGRTLHERNRDDEFDAFLKWLLSVIEAERIDVLLISGDIFDTSTPPYSAQHKYYQFCERLSRTCCRHAVITSGNHDSTQFIDVPSDLLRRFNVNVIGRSRFGKAMPDGDPSDEIVTLKDAEGNDELIIAAVPFLTEGDLRDAEAGESDATKEQKAREGVARHYSRVAEAAEKIRADRDIPVVAMGHLYVAGGKLQEDDGVRTTYIGTLGGVDVSVFPKTFDYVALGHLHVPQAVAGMENIRYSGSPLPMGFGESGQEKSLCRVIFEGRKPEISLCAIPQFHKLARISGKLSEIKEKIEQLMNEGEDCYISVTYTGSDYVDSLVGYINEIIGESKLIHCLHTQNLSAIRGLDRTASFSSGYTLSDLNEISVFEKFLDANCAGQSPEEQQILLDTYKELIASMGR